MYCIKCGNEIPDNADRCPNCGESISKTDNNNEVNNVINEDVQSQIMPEENINNNLTSNNEFVNSYDVPSNGLAALSLIIPPLGLIYYIKTKKDTPIRSKSALNGFIVGIITYILASTIFIYIILPIEKKYALGYQCTHILVLNLMVLLYKI